MLSIVALLFGVVSGHEFINFTIAQERVCPYVNIFNYRLSTFLNVVQDVTFGHYIYSPYEWASFDQTHLWLLALNESFSSDTFASISFPKKIYPITNYFTNQELMQGTIDTSDQSLWYSMDAALNGGNPFISTPYGTENELSLYDFLSSLGYGVTIIPGAGSYVCDDENTWGMTLATVVIKENDKTYVGEAQLITTYAVDNDNDDNWYMTSCAIYWDIQNRDDNGDNLVTNTAFYWGIGSIIFVIVCILIFLMYQNCKLNKNDNIESKVNTELMGKNKNKYETFQDTQD